MRNMTDAAIVELKKSVVHPIILIDVEFSDASLHIWTGIGTMVIGSTTYAGMGNLIKISSVSETMDVQANGVSLSLSGVPASLISEALTKCQHGLPVTISLGCMTNSGAVIADPVVLMAGLMDSASVDEQPENCTITVTVESRLADLQRGRVRRFTDEDQQRTSPGDEGFKYVPMVQSFNRSWDHSRD